MDLQEGPVFKAPTNTNSVQELPNQSPSYALLLWRRNDIWLIIDTVMGLVKLCFCQATEVTHYLAGGGFKSQQYSSIVRVNNILLKKTYCTITVSLSVGNKHSINKR